MGNFAMMIQVIARNDAGQKEVDYVVREGNIRKQNTPV